MISKSGNYVKVEINGISLLFSNVISACTYLFREIEKTSGKYKKSDVESSN